MTPSPRDLMILSIALLLSLGNGLNMAIGNMVMEAVTPEPLSHLEPQILSLRSEMVGNRVKTIYLSGGFLNNGISGTVEVAVRYSEPGYLIVAALVGHNNVFNGRWAGFGTAGYMGEYDGLICGPDYEILSFNDYYFDVAYDRSADAYSIEAFFHHRVSITTFFLYIFQETEYDHHDWTLRYYAVN